MATSGVTEIRVIARAGSLEIAGHPNLGEVRASGTACANSQARLNDVQLLTRRDGDIVVVETVTEQGRLDVSLEVPAGLPLVVDDASGSTVVSDVAALELDDGSGSIRIERVAGHVSVTDRSGSLNIEQVGGSVTIEEDGSGSIRITDVTGDVVIEEDGSGSITVTDVDGSFRVLQDGSGRIRSDRIGGQVSIP
tara:strand:- start:72 stop:653 length:582 start_codon:yes stop_codon:yes gene_type:complete